MRAPLADVVAVVIVMSRRRKVPPQDVAPQCKRIALLAFLLEPYSSRGINLGLSKRSGSDRSFLARHLVGDGWPVPSRVRPILLDTVERAGEETADLARVTRERPVDESLRHHLHKERRLDGLSCMAIPCLQHFDEGDPLAVERLVFGS